jgi:hypothetical protein
MPSVFCLKPIHLTDASWQLSTKKGVAAWIWESDETEARIRIANAAAQVVAEYACPERDPDKKLAPSLSPWKNPKVTSCEVDPSPPTFPAGLRPV